jgi:hypothetical protein
MEGKVGVKDESLKASRTGGDNGVAGAEGQSPPAAFPKGFPKGFPKAFPRLCAGCARR